MAGPNTTGVAKTEDYNLGKGRVYLAELDSSTGKPLAWRFVGNAPDLTANVESETLSHTSSLEGLASTDKEVTVSQEMNVGLSLDEVNFENLANFFSGEVATYSNSVASAGFSKHTMISSANAKKGRWYDIVDSNGARVYDISKSDLTVEDESGIDTYVEGTDFTVDEEFGRIFFVSGGSLDETDGVDVTLASASGSPEGTIDEVRGLTKSAVTVAMRFIGVNPANNDRKTEYTWHQVALKPDGDFSLIGDDWSTMAFSGAAEKNELASPDSPTLTIRSVPAA